jgi:two-component system cell cycle sensor histidine kinase/response regulator CckA
MFENPAAARMLGWNQHESIGRHAHSLMHPSHQAGSGSEAADRPLDETCGPARAAENGAGLIVNSRWSLVRDHHGAPKSILVINTDITEQKQLETQFLRAVAALPKGAGETILLVDDEPDICVSGRVCSRRSTIA